MIKKKKYSLFTGKHWGPMLSRVFLFRRLLTFFLIGIFAFVAEVSGQTIYSTSGAFTYTVPLGVTSLKVECWGAGGGGGGNLTSADGGGGGGGGAYSRSILTVTPGNTYTVTVGAGGTGTTGNGGNGGDTWFISNTTILANGGSGGFSPVAGNGGVAGLGGASGPYGTFIFSGGDGGTGRNNNTGRGGPGGSSAGYASDGTSGSFVWSTLIAAAAPAGGGIGGNAGDVAANGSNGAIPGGGGGGAGDGTQTGGSGASGQVIITIPCVVALNSPTQIAAANVYQGSVKQALFSFETSVSVAAASLSSVNFVTSGTYNATDISNFKLWYNTSNNLATASQIGSSITTTLGIGSHSFTGLSQVTISGATGYFWITSDFPAGATPAAAIQVNALTGTDLIYDLGSVSGSASLGGIQTILPVPNIALSSSNPSVAAANVNQGTSYQPVYTFTTAVTNTQAVLNSVSFTTTGSYQVADITKFKLWYNTSNSFSTANQVGSDIIGTLGIGLHTFTGLSQTTNSGSTGYFWITVDIAPFPTNGRTIAVSALTTGNLTYSLGNKSGSAFAGGTQTIQVVNGILISSTQPAVSASNLVQGTLKQRIYKFTTIVSGTNRTINAVAFTTVGTYAASDIVNFKLWYNSINSLVSAVQLGSTMTASLGTGSHSFSGLTQTTNAGTTGYFWVTADMSPTAVPGNTLTVNAITAANLTYASGTISGTTYAGGIQTVLLNIDTDGDGVSDLIDLDDDNDGIPDVTENIPCNTSQAELFPNSNFDAGNVGFSTGYTYATGANSLVPEGVYTITPNANSVHTGFANCSAGHGNMMVVNGTPNANLIVWSSGTIAVTPYTDYTLSLNLASVNPGNPAQLIFNVNGENIGSQFNATTTNCQWANAIAVWNSGNLTSARFDIVNLNLIASGNDFALDDISCTYRLNCDSDADGIPDKLDIDSDNDGIYDVSEAGGIDANNDGIIDGMADVDLDGLSDNVDNVNSGLGGSEVITGTPLANSDTDADASPNRIDIESDGDGCFDVKEAGFIDTDSDGRLGNSPVGINAKGKVTSAAGYTNPADLNSDGIKDYVQKLPSITTQPANASICLSSTTATSFAVSAVNTGGTYLWQVSTDNGLSWSNLSNGGIYSNVATATLSLSGVTVAYDLYQYRVLLSNPAYICSPLISGAAVLRAFASVPAQPGVISGISTICPSVSSIYNISIVPKTLSYAWTVPAGWLVTSGAGTNSITATSGAASGNISVTASNTCGASPVRALAVTVAAPAVTFTTPVAASACQSADVLYSTQAGNSNYLWNVTTGSPGSDYSVTSGGSATDNTFTLKWITTGIKTVTVNYTGGGCAGTVASKTITINPNTIITTQPSNPAAVCENSGTRTISVVATGTPSYQWEVSVNGGVTWSVISNVAPYSNVATSTLTITNPSIGLNTAQYHCLVTGTCGAASSLPAILTVNANSAVGSVSGSNQLCIGGTANYTANAVVLGIGSGAWSSDNMAVATVNPAGQVTGVSAGNCNIIYTITGGCGGTVFQQQAINVSDFPGAPVAGAITQPTCAVPTGSAVLNNLPASGTWSLTKTPGGSITSGTGTTTTISGLAPGTYTFAVSNSAGCLSASSGNVVINNVPALPTAATASTTLQPNCTLSTGTIAITAPLGAYQYNIDGGAYQALTTFSGIAAGSHTILVRNNSDNTCISSATAVIVNAQPSTPAVNINNPAAVCAPATVDLTAAAITAGSTAGLTYTYFTDVAATISYTSQTAATTGTYYIKGTNLAGCFDIKPVSVLVNPVPAPLISGATEICDPSAENYTTTGIAGNSYSWIVSGGVISGASTNNSVLINWVGTGAGTATLTETIDLTGCQKTTPLYNVTKYETPVLSDINSDNKLVRR